MSYSDKVIDHYNHPRNVGSMDKSSPDVGTGLVGAPECGDVMKLQIKVNRETNVIEEAKFKTFGCGSAIASSSLATEWVKGKTVDEALSIKNMDIVKELAQRMVLRNHMDPPPMQFLDRCLRVWRGCSYQKLLMYGLQMHEFVS